MEIPLKENYVNNSKIQISVLVNWRYDGTFRGWDCMCVCASQMRAL